jgi:hypothetical protein
MGSHLFTSRSGSNLGIRMRKKPTYLYTSEVSNAKHMILSDYVVFNLDIVVIFEMFV